MASIPLESNPWFAHFMVRKNLKESAMLAIAYRIGRERFVSIDPKPCSKGHPKHLHPFAKVHMCHTCEVNRIKEAASAKTKEQETEPVLF